MAFCTNCGKQAEDGVKFCPFCGKALAQPQQPAAPAQPQQQNIQQAQPDAKPPKDKKKKGKTPFIIGGGAVVVAALVCVLVFTNLFGILDKPNGGENNGGNNNSNGENNGVGYYIGGDDEDSYFFIDWETIEMFGGKEGFADWLMNVLELDAEDFYESVYGEYYNSPVEKVSEARGWLDGYENAIDKKELPIEALPGKPATAWPSHLMPDFVPEYPEGVCEVENLDFHIRITVLNTSKGTLSEYHKLLVEYGWDMYDYDSKQGISEGKKDGIEFKGFIFEGDTKVYLNFWY